MDWIIEKVMAVENDLDTNEQMSTREQGGGSLKRLESGGFGQCPETVAGTMNKGRGRTVQGWKGPASS